MEELAAGIGGRVANTIHPDDMPRVEKDLGGHFYEGMTYETTYRMPRRDGSWFWTVDKGKVIRAEDGRLAILSVCTDMSAFVQRQQELESKIRSRIIFSKICRVGMSAAASARVFRSSISASDF